MAETAAASADLAPLLLYLSQGIMADGQPYYAYMAVTEDRLSDLQAAEQSGNFKLEDFGDVLGGEIGVIEPTPEIRTAIETAFIQAFGDISDEQQGSDILT